MSSERLGASFSIDVTDLKAGLSQANRLIKESKSEFDAATAGLDKFSDAQQIAEEKIKHLNKAQDLQQTKVDALQEEYDNLIKNGLDPASAAAVTHRTKLNNEKAALEKTKAEIEKQKKALEEMADASEEAGDAAEDTGEAAEKSGEGFTVAKGAVAGFISQGLTALVGACKNAVTSLIDLSTETREFRQDMATLQTAFSNVGFSSEQATETWKELYAVFGEDDRAVEAANNISRMAKTQEDLNKWVKITTGIWGTYQDALPVEGLAEAAGETAKVGKITGVMADALNWSSEAAQMFAKYMSEDVTNAEDAFNVALAECTTEAERQALITETLTTLYGGAADAYNENAAAVKQANKAQADYNLTMAKVGEEMEPVNTAIAELKLQLAQELTPVLKKEIIPAFKEFVKEAKNSNVINTLGKAVAFVGKNFKTLAGVTLTAVTVFKAFNAAMKVTAAVNAAKTAVAGLSAGVGVATKAQTVWNAAMAANPIGAVITAVALLTTGIILLANAQDKTAKTTNVLSKSQRETVSAAREAAKAYKETKAAADELASSQTANVEYVKNSLLPELQNLVDTNGKVKEVDEARAQFILNELNTALGTEYKSLNDIVDANGKIKDSVYQVIEAKKAQILLEAYEDSYREAVENVAKAEKARATTAQGLAKAQDEYSTALAEVEKAQKRVEEAQKSGSTNELLAATNARYAAWQTRDEKKAALDKQAEDYGKATQTVQGYYTDISSYETASTLVMQGETEKAVGYLNNLGSGFITAADVAQQSKNKQLKTLKQQVIDTEVNLGLLEADYKAKQGSMTDEEKRQAQARIDNAKKQATDAKDEYYKVGGNMVEGMKRGAEDGEWTLTGAFKGLVNKALKAAKKAAGIKSPSRKFRKEVGLQIGLGTALGIQDSTAEIIKSAKAQVKAISNVFDAGALSGELAASVQSSNVAQSGTGKTAGGVVVYQTNNYAQAHTRNELYKSKQATAAAVRLALAGV